MEGRIIRGIAGFYYVYTGDGIIWECKAKGSFRKDGIKPLVGDFVRIDILNEQEKQANIIEILPRKNFIIRPAMANVDQALLLFALKSPDPDGTLLDRFLITMARQDIPVILCFNKEDLAGREEIEEWKDTYKAAGYPVLVISAHRESDRQILLEALSDKTTVIAGPSGAGKSTVTNLLQNNVFMETGEISRKLKRGRHTTRRAELIQIDDRSWFADTPGFTSMEVPEMPKEELETCFPEFAPYIGRCRFPGCAHMAEPDCAVKEAVEEGQIRGVRYERYRKFYEELKEREKRRY
ncbi:MAG: ribosome small subunit-dependent GTPase A [Eubacterium sp.]|nr:ribosome small subunit-dependent GTPase A [Eubacterium sp.]